MLKWMTSWPRLWRILAGLYLGVGLVCIGITLVMTHRDIARTRLVDSINAVSMYRNAHEPDFTFPYADEVLAREYRDLSDEAIITRLHAEWGGTVDFSEIEAEYKQKVAAFPEEQLALVLFLVLYLWGLPVLLFYALGTGVPAVIAWGIQRFRRTVP